MRHCARTNVSKCFSLVTKETTARSSSQGAAAKTYRPAVGQDPETAELRHRGLGRRGELRAMIVIDIFKENHRFSEKTSHPGPHSVVVAANLAASGKEVEMPVGAVLIQGLNASVDAENTPANFASVTLNLAPTLVVATTSINTVRHTMNNLGIEFSDIALISSFQVSGGPVTQPENPAALTMNNVVSITFELGTGISGFPPLPSTVLGQHSLSGAIIVQGFD